MARPRNRVLKSWLRRIDNYRDWCTNSRTHGWVYEVVLSVGEQLTEAMCTSTGELPKDVYVSHRNILVIYYAETKFEISETEVIVAKGSNYKPEWMFPVGELQIYIKDHLPCRMPESKLSSK